MITLNKILTKLKEENKTGIYFYKNKTTIDFVPYSMVYKSALKVLYFFQKNGVLEGNEIIIQVEDNEYFIYVFWGCILGGIIPIPITVGNDSDHMMKVLKIWEVLSHPYLFTDDSNLERLNNYASDNNLGKITEINNHNFLISDIKNALNCDKIGKLKDALLEDIAFVQFSSGSTGAPKGVVLTHENLITNIHAIIDSLKISKEDTALSWLPLTHDMGLIGMHLTIMEVNTDLYLIPTKLFIMYPTMWLDEASKHKIKILCSPNFGYQYFLQNYNKEVAEKWDLSSIRWILNGAEPIYYKLCNKFLNAMNQYKLDWNTILPVYGMAEASLAVAFSEGGRVLEVIFVDRNSMGMGDSIKQLNKQDFNAIGIVLEGKAVSNCRIRICNGDYPLEDLHVGEIQIKGRNVTKGYYNNPEEYKKIITEGGWLKTGDLGFTFQGKLAVTGRLKDILFVNGVNYYPQDIEQIVEELNDKWHGKVVASSIIDQSMEREEIGLFIVYRKKIESFIPLAMEIKMYIRNKMGLYIKYVIPVKKIYKTTSGKVQRHIFSQHFENNEYSDIIDYYNSHVKNNKEEEEKGNNIELGLLHIVCNILKVDNIGLKDNLFEFGMDSLKSSAIISEIEKEMKLSISYKDFFESNSVEELANKIIEYKNKNLKRKENKTFLQNIEILEEKYYQTASSQKRLSIMEQLNENSICNNMPEVIQIEGNIALKQFDAAVNTLIKRHESLRTIFKYINGEFVQTILESVTFQANFYKTTYDKIDKIITNTIVPFHLEKAPLIHIALIEVAESKYILIVDMHHIIADGWSLLVFLKELGLLLNGNALPEKEFEYKDFVNWQFNRKNTNELKQQKDYWILKLKNVDQVCSITLPSDFKRPKKKTFAGDRIVKEIDSDIVIGIDEINKKTATTLHMFMLTAYVILLFQYTGQEEMIVGTPVAGRPNGDYQNVIGMFVNMLPIRIKMKNDMSFLNVLEEVKQSCLEAYENQYYQFDELVANLNIKRDLSRNPLFDYVFAVQNFDLSEIEVLGQLRMKPYDYTNTISRFDMFLSVIQVHGSVRFILEYSTELFKHATVVDFLDNYINLVKNASGNIGVIIKDMNGITSFTEAKYNGFNTDDGEFNF